jgi:phosphonate transport system substrate-binding protein
MRCAYQSLHRFQRQVVIYLLLCFFSIVTMPAFAAENYQELLIGIEPEHNIFDQVERYRHLADYLSNQLGVEIKLTIMSRYGEVIKRFKSLRLDGAFLSPYTATMGIKELNLEPLVNPVNLNGESTTQGYIFVRKDSNIRSIADMRGGTIAFVDPATLEGYLFPLLFLKQHGVNNINTFFSRSYFTGSHASTIYAVLDGRADIGAAKSTVYKKLVKSDPTIGQELGIIAESLKVPEFTLCIKSEIDQDLRDRLSDLLLHMNETSDGQKVLKQFQAQRFNKSKKDDFTIIERMAQEALGTLTVHGE